MMGSIEGPPKQKQKNKDQQKSRQKATDRLPFLFYFILGAPCVGCGHATAYGHPQLAVGSSFTS
jgi:hypothetical protein